MVIYLTGIDGSGKSSIAQKLKNEIIKGEVQTAWARYEPKMVKHLIAPFKRKYVKDIKKDYLMDGNEYSKWSKYKRKITRNQILSKCLFLLQSLDYGFQLRKFNPLFKNNYSGTLILDRYLLDFLVDQSVNYGDISKSLITRICLKRLQKLDFIFFIDTEEEVAFSRKTDIPSIQFLKKRRNYYKEFISKLDNGHIVTNNSDMRDTIKTIELILAQRT